MKHHAAVVLAVFGGAACSTSPVTAPPDAEPQFAIGTQPFGFGFNKGAGSTGAGAITDGGQKRCVAAGSGAGQWFLTLTPGIVSKVRAALAAGATAEVEVYTKFRYVGDGQMTARETIDLVGAGGSIGNATASGTAINPGHANGGVIVPRTKRFPVAAASFTSGGQLSVRLTGNVTAVLPACSVTFGGAAFWSYSMPVLRVTP